jgi:hypothetical protein
LLDAANPLKLIFDWALTAQTLPLPEVLLPLLSVVEEQGFNSFHIGRVLDLFRLIARSFGTFAATTGQHLCQRAIAVEVLHVYLDHFQSVGVDAAEKRNED